MGVHIETRESWAGRRGTGVSMAPIPITVCGGSATVDGFFPGFGWDVYNYEEAVECIEGGPSQKAGSPAPCRECMQRVSLQVAVA